MKGRGFGLLGNIIVGIVRARVAIVTNLVTVQIRLTGVEQSQTVVAGVSGSIGVLIFLTRIGSVPAIIYGASVRGISGITIGVPIRIRTVVA